MKLNDLLRETPRMDMEEYGSGFTQYWNDDFILDMGVTSGNSPPGTIRKKYFVYDAKTFTETQDANASKIGFVELFINDEDHTIEGIVNIEILPKFRKGGYGKRLVQTIRDTAGKEITINDIQKKAKKFWDKMGVQYDNKATSLDGKL